MSLHVLIGPPGSGRSTRLLGLARDACRAGRRAWWVGLPAQRASVYRRATEAADGTALLGLEFLTAQQVYYRLLARERLLRPLLLGSGRLVAVGQALAEVANEVPSPGEARLFAYAIAEAKRFGVSPAAAGRADDPERRRFAAVYDAYERIKGEAWDYDDFRAQALELVRVRPEACEAEVVVVDGLREIGPLELRIFRELARAREVHVSLPRLPPGGTGDDTEVEELPPGPPARIERYRAANPVAEARWVLRAVKRDLAVGGLEPLGVAIVAPPERARAVAALAEEYGLPIMDETPLALADTEAGRVLVELLELPDHPTPSRLLAVPELKRLANAALEAGVAGDDAITALAQRLGLGETWRSWRDGLEVGDAPVAWARRLVLGVVPSVLQGSGRGGPAGPAGADAGPDAPELAGASDAPLSGPAGVDAGSDVPLVGSAGVDAGPDAPGAEAGPAFERFAAEALQKAQEASRLAGGPSFRAWWAALLQQARAPRERRGGVALLSATLASGRRFERLYLLGAVEGAYGVGEAEDYFVPEEARVDADVSFRELGLPHRFQGRDEELFEELLARAPSVVVTYPEADQGGQLVPEPALAAGGGGPLPPVPAGSALELAAPARFFAQLEAVPLGDPTVERLRRYDACAFRFWAEGALPDQRERPWWRDLVDALRAEPRLDRARLEELRGAFPLASDWLAAHAERLAALTYGVVLPATVGEGPRARLDAALRGEGRATVVRFTAPDRVDGAAAAEAYVKGRWNELWAAGHLLERYPRQVRRVDITVWPVLSDPIDVFPNGITYPWRTIGYRTSRAAAALERFARGDTPPSPGFQCRECRVFDLCREGRRS